MHELRLGPTASHVRYGRPKARMAESRNACCWSSTCFSREAPGNACAYRVSYETQGYIVHREAWTCRSNVQTEGPGVLGRSRVRITARCALLQMKTRNDTLVINTISCKEHSVLESVCDRDSFVQIVDAMIGAMARCPGGSSGNNG